MYKYALLSVVAHASHIRTKRKWRFLPHRKVGCPGDPRHDVSDVCAVISIANEPHSVDTRLGVKLIHKIKHTQLARFQYMLPRRTGAKTARPHHRQNRHHTRRNTFGAPSLSVAS